LFAIFDCVEFGLPQSLEGGIRSEMTSFSRLILRPEPRAMIQTMFLGRVDYERRERKGQLPDLVDATIAAVRGVLVESRSESGALAAAGFAEPEGAQIVRERLQPGYWIEAEDEAPTAALAVLKRIHDVVAPLAVGRSNEDLRIADYAAVKQAGYPAYLGGPFAFRSKKWS
jgi:3-hydroxyacyl-CoA dehydrogenase/enoyl-CoA hydratase/3-hydroxybutyryl-CoA epimerase